MTALYHNLCNEAFAIQYIKQFLCGRDLATVSGLQHLDRSMHMFHQLECFFDILRKSIALS
jgi:hypothetical protein